MLAQTFGYVHRRLLLAQAAAVSAVCIYLIAPAVITSDVSALCYGAGIALALLSGFSSGWAP